MSRQSTASARALAALNARVIACNRCERLRTYCTQIAETKRRAYLAENAAAAAIRLTAEQVSSLDVLFAPEAVAGARYNEAGMKDIGL